MKDRYVLAAPVLVLSGLISLASAGSGIGVSPTSVVPAAQAAGCAWTIGASAVYLEASGGNYGDQDYKLTHRFDLTYDNGGAFGYRFTYFDFEGVEVEGGAPYHPDIAVMDLELVRDLSLASWKGSYSFGVRYLDYVEHHRGYHEIIFDGWGPTLGIDLVTPVAGSSWGVYANARASWVIGEDDQIYSDDMDNILVIEAGLGVQFTFGRCDSYVRLGVEAQRYFNIDSNGYVDDVDVAGAVVRLGYRF